LKTSEIIELNERSKDNDYLFNSKLQEKEEEIRSMKEELNSMRSEMNDVLEVLKIAKSKNGKIGMDRTMLDEKRRLTFGYVNSNSQIVELKIPIDGVEIDERE
jgi:seryl-tRNA synthetase